MTARSLISNGTSRGNVSSGTGNRDGGFLCTLRSRMANTASVGCLIPPPDASDVFIVNAQLSLALPAGTTSLIPAFPPSSAGIRYVSNSAQLPPGSANGLVASAYSAPTARRADSERSVAFAQQTVDKAMSNPPITYRALAFLSAPLCDVKLCFCFIAYSAFPVEESSACPGQRRTRRNMEDGRVTTRRSRRSHHRGGSPESSAHRHHEQYVRRRASRHPRQ